MIYRANHAWPRTAIDGISTILLRRATRCVLAFRVSTVFESVSVTAAGGQQASAMLALSSATDGFNLHVQVKESGSLVVKKLASVRQQT